MDKDIEFSFGVDEQKLCIYLMSHGFITRDDNAELYTLATTGKTLSKIRYQFNIFNISIIEDDTVGLIFLEQNFCENIPKLIPNKRLSPRDSIILIILRNLYSETQKTGVSQILSFEKIKSLMSPYIKEKNNENSINKKINGLIEKCIRFGVLKKDKEFYIILPLIKYKVNHDSVTAILEEYKKIMEAQSTDE